MNTATQTDSKLLAPCWGVKHAAELHEPDDFEYFHRKEDLLDEGVGAVFGIRQGEAELQALCFDPVRFSPEQAQDWLHAMGFQPRSFWTADIGL